MTHTISWKEPFATKTLCGLDIAEEHRAEIVRTKASKIIYLFTSEGERCPVCESILALANQKMDELFRTGSTTF